MTGYEERYAMEMISNAANMLKARIEVQQKLTEDGFTAERIILHMPDPTKYLPPPQYSPPHPLL